MLADAVIEPLTEEDGTLEDVDPEEGHEDNLTLHDGTCQRLTSGEAMFRCLESHTKSLHLNKIFLLAGSSIKWLSIALTNINKNNSARYPI